MNSKTKKVTVFKTGTQQEVKCKPQCDNKNVRELDFDVTDIISFADKSEARAYLENHFNFDVFVDETEFLEFLKGFAEEGEPMLQNILGICLIIGYGCEENPHEALKWWTKAAEQGDLCSQRCLWSCYYSGNSGIRKNYKKAFHWLEQAALQNDDESQFMLGVCHYNGQGVQKSREKAFECFKMAAESGHPDAQYHLANYYLNGCVVEKDVMEAWEWFNLAAEQGQEEAASFVNSILDSVRQDQEA